MRTFSGARLGQPNTLPWLSCSQLARIGQSWTRWRRGWDSNPRATFAAAGFQVLYGAVLHCPFCIWHRVFAVRPFANVHRGSVGSIPWWSAWSSASVQRRGCQLGCQAANAKMRCSTGLPARLAVRYSVDASSHRQCHRARTEKARQGISLPADAAHVRRSWTKSAGDGV